MESLNNSLLQMQEIPSIVLKGVFPLIFLSIWWLAIKQKFQSLKYFIEVVVTFTLFLILLPAILAFVGTNELVRFVLNKYLIWKTNGQVQLMSNGPDGIWGFERDSDPSTCTFMYIIKGKGNLEKLRKHFELKVLGKQDPIGTFPFEKLRQTCVARLGYFCWSKESKFDVKNHVKYLHEVKGPDDVIRESQMPGIFSRLTNELLDSSKPQWEQLLVPNFKYDDEAEDSPPQHYAIIGRMHHTIGDAISWVHLVRYGMADDPSVKMPVEPLAPLNIPKWRIYLAYLMIFFLGPRSLFKFFTSREKNCLHTRKELTGPKFVQIQNRFDVSTLKAIKEKSNTSITAVINSCISGGLRHYFLSQGQEVPMEITSVTTGAMLPYPDYGPKNRFSLVPFPLAVGLDTMEKRLEASFEATLNFYRGPELPLYYFLTVFVGRLPTFLVSSTWRIGHATIVFSNVPGPMHFGTVCDGDMPVDAIGFTPIKCYTGVSMCALSYAGKLRLSILADKEAIKSEENSKLLMKFIEEELDAHTEKFLNNNNNSKN